MHLGYRAAQICRGKTISTTAASMLKVSSGNLSSRLGAAQPKPDDMLKLKCYSHPDYTLLLPDAHTFPMARYEEVANEMGSEAAQACGIRVVSPSTPATLDQVCLAHDSTYMQKFVRGQMTDLEVRTMGFPWSYELVRRTFRITGATLSCVEDVLSRDFRVSGNLAGGTHHAFRSHAEGYCIVNDIGVAAKVAQQDHQVGQCLVIDLDVHQGNGTAEIFDGDDSVFTFSLHGEKNYPWKSRHPSDLDIGVMDDVSADEYLSAVEKGLSEIEQRVSMDNLDLVFYQAGVDALAEDRLGRLKLTRNDLQARNALVYSWCEAWDKRIVITMGGGYSKDIKHSVQAHSDVFFQAANML